MTPEQDKPHFAQAAETLANIKEKLETMLISLKLRPS